MLWSPNEVLAYLKEDLNLQNNVIDKRENQLVSKTAAFGGFPAWSSVEQDFIFIAENSEIYGPNPLFTIPSQPKEIDLNVLSTRILSADYQGLSSKKIISLKHAQLLMPDISKNIHAVVNYFLLFDTEARGFIRPACLAYITSDKYKLIQTADSVLETLSEASTILQHCNMLYTIGNLKVMLQDITSQTIDKDENNRRTALQNKVTEDVTKDIQDIIDVIEAYEGNDLIDKQLSTILDKLKNSNAFSEVSKLFSISSSSTTEPTQWKNKNHHSQKKNMKSFYSMCGNGLILGLYHLYILHKHVRRKYENIYLSKYYDHQPENDEQLHFGACVKISDMNSSRESFPVRECTLNVKRFTKVPSLDSEEYFLCLDTSFEKILLDFLNWEINTSHDAKQNNSFLQSSDLSDASTEPESTCSSSSGYLSYDSDQTEGYENNLCGHIVTLENIWDILDNLQRENPGIESAFLEILKLFDDTKKLLFSLLTRTPIVIISMPEECHIAQNFIKALSVFIPRGKHEFLLVDLDRKEPFRTDDFKNIAALNICVRSNKAVEEIIPHHIWHSLCILNLRDCSLTAPAYSGILLNNIDERFRMLPLEGPAFPIFVGILCEVQSALEWWLMVTLPSVNESNATSSILSKGFSRLDGQILLNLSKICRS